MNAWLVEQGLLDIARAIRSRWSSRPAARYRAPLAFPEDVEVGLAVAQLGRSSMRYRIGIFADGAETAAAEGEFVHVMVDRASRRPVPISRALARGA